MEVIFTSLLSLIFLISQLLSLILVIGVFFSNRKSNSNRVFSFLGLSIILWLSANYTAFLPTVLENKNLFLILARSSISFAVLMSLGFLLLAKVIPENHSFISRKILNTLYLVTFVVILINLSPFSFKDVDVEKGLAGIETDWGIIAFTLLTTFFSVSAVVELLRKTHRFNEPNQKNQIKLVLFALSALFLLIVFTVLLPIIISGLTFFVPFTPLYVLQFLGITAYAITRHHLFNIKVIVTQLLVFALWLVILIPTLLSKTFTDWLVNGLTLALVVVAGLFLIRSVKKEVDQREKIEGLARELGHVNNRLWVANERLKELDKMKTEFVSMATHQLRSPLTAIKGYASMILENSFGPVAEKARGAVDIIFQSSQKLVTVIEDFLNISRIELGTMKYEKIEFDLCALAETIIKEQRPNIEKRGLQLSFESEPSENYKLVGDSGKFSQVINNLIDNAVKYTPQGWIKIMLNRIDGKIRLVVADSGVGIPAEVIPKLFQKFIRAEGAGKINIQGTGLGLYVARQIVEAHGGKIWAESDGVGKGSRFVVEI
ncbi:MAG: hypothetical protein HYT21_03260 [Candidatus Nealsonbacteria bacterium]|nr:hypothetical protein [Candidatus Nealsonbacteria bacterium]